MKTIKEYGVIVKYWFNERRLFLLTILENRALVKEWLKKRWLFLLTIVVFIILVITPIAEKIAFVPDFLNLSKVNLKDFFGLIIGAIASIFGILMAVILLTVEFFKEKLNKNEHTNPLENKLIRNSIYNSVNLIGLSFVAYILFDNFNTPKSLTIGYFIGWIFVLYIYSVYPVLKRIIGKSSQIKSNIDLINDLNFNSFKTASKFRFNKPEEGNEILKTLKKELDLYIIANNISAYEKINNDILTNALNIISNGQNRANCDIVISGLTWLWRENSKSAIRVNDAYYFELIWNYIKEIYVHFAKQKAPLLNLQDLYFFISYEFLRLHVKLNNSLPFSVALDCIEISFNSNVNYNYPKQDHLQELVRMYEGGDFDDTAIDDSMQWDSLKDILEYITKIQETAILLEDKDVYKDSSRRIENILYYINFHNKTLGYYQKGDITWHTLTYSFTNSYKALKKEMYPNTLDCYEIPRSLIVRLIEQNKLDEKDIRIIIRTLADNIILAFMDNKLFMNQQYGTLNGFCMIGIHSMKYYWTNAIAKNTVNYIIKVLRHLKKLAEKDLLSVNPNNYLAIKSKINHFAKVAARFDEFDEDKKPLKKWKAICDDFKEVEKEIDFGIVKWKVE